MHITVDRALFLKALAHGQSVVEKRGTIPILSHVLLEASNGQVTLTSTDMEIALIESVPADVITAGALTVSVQMLGDIVRKLSDAHPINLSLDQNSGQLQIKSGRSRFNLSTLNAEDFPKITASALPVSFQMPCADLKHLLDCSRFAMAIEDTRYFLNGIYFHVAHRGPEAVLRCVATDAHRLACIDVAMPEGAAEMPGLILSRKTVTEIRKLLEEGESVARISLSDKRIEVQLTNATISSRVIDGVYPDYTKAIPSHNDKPMIVASKEFASAVDRVATVAHDKLRIVKMNALDNMLTLSAASQELGSAVEEISVDFSYAEPIEIGFNARYLLEIAQQINEDEAQITFSASNQPAIIKGMLEKNALYVLMPMLV